MQLLRFVTLNILPSKHAKKDGLHLSLSFKILQGSLTSRKTHSIQYYSR